MALVTIVMACGAGMLCAQNDGGRQGSNQYDNTGGASYDSGSGSSSGSYNSGSSNSQSGSNSGNESISERRRREREEKKKASESGSESSTSEESRSSRRSRRESNEEPAEAGTAASGMGADGASNTVGAQARSAEEGGRRAAAITGLAAQSMASRAPAPTIRFEQKLRGHYPVLMFSPPSLSLKEGDTADVSLLLHNPQLEAADHLFLALQYDPLMLKVTKLDLEPLLPWFEGRPVIQFDARKGVLVVEAYFNKPLRWHQQSLMNLKIEALQPVPTTRMRLRPWKFSGQRQEQPSGLYLERRNVLGLQRIRDDGLVPLDVEIVVDPASIAEVEARSLEAEIARAADPLVFGRGARGGIELTLKAATTQLQVGDEVEVDVDFLNPASSDLDYVRVLIAFDPAVFEAVDSDEGNAITRGVNLREGNRSLFPFDYNVVNDVSNQRGRAEYRMGFTGSTRWPREGTLATLRLRARGAVRSTEVRFLREGEEKLVAGHGTAVRFIGRDVLGTLDDPMDGMRAIGFSVQP